MIPFQTASHLQQPYCGRFWILCVRGLLLEFSQGLPQHDAAGHGLGAEEQLGLAILAETQGFFHILVFINWVCLHLCIYTYM